MLPSLLLAFAAPFFLATRTNAETHTIKFVNNCGFGSPVLMFNGSNILQGDTFTNDTFSGIAYLQTGYCNTNGENCTLLETTLINPTIPGGGSSTDISLIDPHVYSVETSFAYYNGCDGQGKTCNAAYCPGDAFYQPDDTYVQVGCETNDVNLLVAFCANASLIVSPNSAVPPSSPGDTTLTSSLPTTTSSSPTSTPSSPTSDPFTNSLTSSVSDGTGSSSPSSSLPTSTPAATISTPGALSVSPTGSATVSASPSTTPHQCHPKTSSVPPVPNPTTATSVGAGTTTPDSASSPPPFSAPTVATPAPTSTPGALNVSPTGSATGEPNPTGTSPRRCRPRTSSVPPALAPTTTPAATDTLAPSPATTTTATAGNNPPPKQCRAPSPTPSTSPSTPTPLRHRRARHARLPLTH